jgi:hypothetical protein
MKRIIAGAMASACVLAAGCGGKSLGPPGTGGQVVLVTGSPQAIQSAPARHAVTGATSATVVSSVGGLAAAGGASGVFIASRSIADSMTAMSVAASGSDPTSTGAVSFMARRNAGGALVQAQNGLFEDFSGYLLASPLWGTVSGDSPTAVDALGAEPSEELWFNAPKGVLHVVGGQMDTVSIQGVSAPADAVVAAGANQAVIAAAGTAYFVDLKANQVQVVGDNLGTVNGFDHSDDGTVYLATSAGLYQRTRAGTASLFTLVPAGSTAQNVLAVSAAYGTVLAVTATSLVEISNNVPTGVATLTQGAAGRSVAVDTNGDGWVLDQGQLAHFLTGKPVSYASDVKPFFDKHCTVCHWTTPAGTTANSAPATDWDDYATAKSLAPLAILRMEGSGYTPMPPATANDPLTAADYAVVIRWVGGGYQP